jgi:hypothetical protein
MDLAENDARNDCAGKDQQQFNRPTERIIYYSCNHELRVDSGGRVVRWYPAGKEKNVHYWNRNQATACEDKMRRLSVWCSENSSA